MSYDQIHRFISAAVDTLLDFYPLLCAVVNEGKEPDELLDALAPSLSKLPDPPDGAAAAPAAEPAASPESPAAAAPAEAPPAAQGQAQTEPAADAAGTKPEGAA